MEDRIVQDALRTSGTPASVEVHIPYPLRELTGGLGTVELKAETVADAIARVNERFPGVAYRVLDDQGRLRRYVNVFVNDEPVSHLDPSDVRLQGGDVITILPSIAGG